MQKFELTILGCSSATPTSDRNPTSQVLNVHEQLFLIDCGEAAQIQLRKYKIRFQKIDRIFISHLHGDHYLGLVGLLGTMHLLGRTKKLHVYAPKGLKEIVDIQHHYSDTFLRFPLEIRELDTQNRKIVFENDKVSVETIPLNHRIPCCGFLFREKPGERKMIVEKLAEYKIPVAYISKIKQGGDYVTADGRIIPNAELTLPPDPPRSYAYCSDTLYHPALIGQVNGAGLLYHEATFASDMAARAAETFHSTAAQAASIALQAGVKQLIIGHYSARYTELDVLHAEAKAIFENTLLAEEGKTYPVPAPTLI
ncbi:MAG: ribonuclease Z [Bacteroidota bacterium]